MINANPINIYFGFYTAQSCLFYFEKKIDLKKMFTLEKKCISYKNTLTFQMLKIPNILCLPHNGLTPLTYVTFGVKNTS